VNDVNQQNAEGTVAEVKAQGVRTMAVLASVADEKEVRDMVARVVTEWGGIHKNC